TGATFDCNCARRRARDIAAGSTAGSSRICGMRILALETSTDWCSIAVGDGARWHRRDERAGQRHSERLLPMIDAALAEAGWSLSDLDGLAFGAGPGSFTGLRLGCGVAQGMALGRWHPV